MEIVKRAIRLMHEGKCIYDQFQLDEDYNVPDAKEDVGNVIEGTVCVKTEDMKLVENYLIKMRYAGQPTWRSSPCPTS